MAEAKNGFLARLDELEGRYERIEKQIADPAIAGNSAKVIELSKEQGKLRDIVRRYREYKGTIRGIEEAGV